MPAKLAYAFFAIGGAVVLSSAGWMVYEVYLVFLKWWKAHHKVFVQGSEDAIASSRKLKEQLDDYLADMKKPMWGLFITELSSDVSLREKLDSSIRGFQRRAHEMNKNTNRLRRILRRAERVSAAYREGVQAINARWDKLGPNERWWTEGDIEHAHKLADTAQVTLEKLDTGIRILDTEIAAPRQGHYVAACQRLRPVLFDMRTLVVRYLGASTEAITTWEQRDAAKRSV